jgi:hypothetical protein
MEKLDIPAAQLTPSQLTFHGIMPGHSCSPMGRIQLEVMFGKKGNSRHESIWFEVVDISSPYHALLGRRVMPTHFYSCRHLLGLQVQRFVEQQQVSLKWITQGLSNSGRKRSKLSLSSNPAITI